MDYNKNLNVIAGVYKGSSINLWDGMNGSDICGSEVISACIELLLFNLNNNKLYSLDILDCDIRIWSIDYQNK